MSADYYIYTDYIDEFDRADFESWALKHGYELELYPDFSIRDNGFAPIRFRAPFVGEGSWKSGFELFSSENDVIDMTAEPVEIPVPKKQGFFAKLFGKKPKLVAIPPEYRIAPEPGEPSPFERTCAEKKWIITASCFAREPLEVLCCYLLAGYFCEKYGAVIEDPQAGGWYTDPAEITAEFKVIEHDIVTNYKSWGQEFLPFTDWETEL